MHACQECMNVQRTACSLLRFGLDLLSFMDQALPCMTLKQETAHYLHLHLQDSGKLSITGAPDGHVAYTICQTNETRVTRRKQQMPGTANEGERTAKPAKATTNPIRACEAPLWLQVASAYKALSMQGSCMEPVSIVEDQYSSQRPTAGRCFKCK